MRNNREPFILIILIVFLLFKSNQPDSSSYRFSAELDNWKRYNYPREIKEEHFIVVEKKEDSKTVRNTFDRVFKHNDENEKEKEINNENIKNQHTVKNVITVDLQNLSNAILAISSGMKNMSATLMYVKQSMVPNME